MKKYLLRGALLLVLVLFASCRSRITVNGQSYAALEESEIRELVKLARNTMQKNAKAVSPEELHFIRTKEPRVDVQYTGDCTGKMFITWTTREKKINIILEGELLEPTRGWLFMTEEIQPDTLYFLDDQSAGNKKNPASRRLKQPKHRK